MITAEEKQRFLEFIRQGNDRATAAFLTNPDLTGTQFKRMVNPTSSKYYDAEFADAYAAAVAERGAPDRARALKIRSEERDSSHLRHNGFTKANHLSEEQLDAFLDLVSTGVQAAAAARQIEPPTSITQIHRRVERDPDFAERFHQAKEEGYPAYKEELRAEATRQAFAGDYRALRDQMLIHLEEAKVLFTSRHEVTGLDGGAIRMLAEKHFHELPPDMLETLIRMVEERERGQLPPAGEEAA